MKVIVRASLGGGDEANANNEAGPTLPVTVARTLTVALTLEAEMKPKMPSMAARLG